MKNLLKIFLATILYSSSVFAAVIPNNTVLGNVSGSNAPAQAITFGALSGKTGQFITVGCTSGNFSAQYSTSCNSGTSTDHTAINNAITAANSAGGGVVYLLPGTYYIGATVTMKDNVSLIGSGRGATTLFLKASTAANVITASQVSNFTIQSLTVDGNLANNQQVALPDNLNNSIMVTGVTNGVITDNEITGAGWHGIFMQDGFDTNGLIVSKNFLHGNGFRAAHLHGNDTVTSKNVIFTQNESYANGQATLAAATGNGGVFVGFANAHNLVITDNVAHDEPYNCFAVSGKNEAASDNVGADRFVFANNVADTCGASAVSAASGSAAALAVTGGLQNTVFSNFISYNTYGAGVYIGGISTNETSQNLTFNNIQSYTSCTGGTGCGGIMLQASSTHSFKNITFNNTIQDTGYRCTLLSNSSASGIASGVNINGGTCTNMTNFGDFLGGHASSNLTNLIITNRYYKSIVASPISLTSASAFNISNNVCEDGGTSGNNGCMTLTGVVGGNINANDCHDKDNSVSVPCVTTDSTSSDITFRDNRMNVHGTAISSNAANVRAYNTVLGSNNGSLIFTASSSNSLAEGTIFNGTGRVVNSGTNNIVRNVTDTVVTTQFDKASNTTLANITGLTANVQAAGAYRFRAVLHVTPDVTGGHKYAMAGTATATSIIYEVVSVDNTLNTNVITSRQTALAGSAGQAGATSAYTVIEGEIVVNAGGTLTVQFAQNAASGTSSILVGSVFKVERIY